MSSPRHKPVVVAVSHETPSGNPLVAAVTAAMLTKVDAFNRQVLDLPIPSTPKTLDAKRARWAELAMLEEVGEFMEACHDKDTVGAADALIDLVYFALGRLVEMGVPAMAVFDEVHRANMDKERGTLAKRPHSKGFDAVKPSGWQGPDHSWLLDFDLARAEQTLQQSEQWQQLSPFLKDAAQLRVSKGNDYNTGTALDDYFPLGHLSYFQMILVKYLRIKSLLVLMASGRSPNHEALLDSVRDLSNYLTYYGERLIRGDLPQINDVDGMLRGASS